jgi:LPS O-antigen subunit length determinant protein (WzzB/FepE family)
MAEQHIQPILEGEIDLLKLVKVFWKGRLTLLLCLVAGTILGVYLAISSPKEYTATTVMVPQSGARGQSQLSGLAAMAGINLANEQSTEISPLIYPKIVNSVPFKLELMTALITSSDFKQPVSLFDYYNRKQKTSVLTFVKKYTIGLPVVIIDQFTRKQKNPGLPEVSSGKSTEINKPIQPIQLTGAQYSVKSALDGAISLGLDAKQGYITLSVRMPEALAAAQVAQIAQELLQRHIIEFKIKKAKADLDFIQERYNVAKAEAEKFQVSVAMNTDRVKNFTSTLPQVENARVQAQYAIASSVFQDLARQLEQAKIQVKKDTPVFTIVEPVSVPLLKSKPNPPKILFMWIFLSGFVGVFIIFTRHYLPHFRKKWSEVD